MRLRWEVRETNGYHRREDAPPLARFNLERHALGFAGVVSTRVVYDRLRCEYLDDRDGSLHA